ncbi:PLP-dependent aminotransferase family protein [Paenibacillus polygoni]|uniref:PLP-dependent aminotransferase family protein n=1 Tax=Paenibacillus polygoni TaxID=3050112 RepID=A0ABY8X3E9_9BACL|nr:PLP-dependent aminotransferase family protein [Paenibacillus polygoni]WIV18972.1 PLP-dependent aminotransferase family protein [Paenibacillus polygoni]
MKPALEIRFTPDPLLPEPLYHQIKEYIKMKIMQGEWTPGMRLPSQRALAAAFKVNRSTIIAALDGLHSEGLIDTNYGGGTKISRAGWNSMSTPLLNWEDYVESGHHYPNLPEVQIINQSEYRSDIIRLGTGELSPDLLPQSYFQKIYDKLAQRAPSLGYLEPLGSYKLRLAISSYLADQQIQASPESILIVSGSLQAMQLIAMGLLPRRSSVLVEKPSYLYSIHAFQTAGVRMIGMPVDKEGLLTAELERYIRQNRPSLLYTIPTFQNPSGAVMSDKRRMELIQTAEATGLAILEDHAYADLWFDEKPPLSLKARDPGSYVLHMGTLSKSVSPGLRIGWVAGPETVIQRLADIKMQTDYGASSLAQEAAALWFTEGYHDVHLAEVRAALIRKRNLVLDLLSRNLAGAAEWNVPQGGFYIWLKLLNGTRPETLFRRALAEGVLLNPGSIYDRFDQDHIRLSFAYASETELERGIMTLARLILHP